MSDNAKLTDDERRRLLEEIRRRSEEAEFRRLDEEERTEDDDAPVAPSSYPSHSAPPRDAAPGPFDVPPAAPFSSDPFGMPEKDAHPPAPFPVDPFAVPESPLPDPFAMPERGSIPPAPFPVEPFPVPEPPPVPPAPLPADPFAIPERPAPLPRDPFEYTPPAHKKEEFFPAPGQSPLPSFPDDTYLMPAEPIYTPEPAPAAPEEIAPPPAPMEHVDLHELMEKAEWNYQHESYDKAAGFLDEILARDPGNSDATRLKSAVERAQTLATRIAEEDAATRAKMVQAAADAKKPVAPPKRDGDPWGSQAQAAGSIGFDVAPEQQGPITPPKPPKGKELVQALSRMRVLIKPLVITAGVVGIAFGGYFLLKALTQTVVPQKASVLVLPGVAGGGDPAMAQLAEGLTDDIIRKLGMVSDLRVLAPTSAFILGSTPSGPAQAARLGHAGFCLQWSVVGTPDAMSIQCALFDSSSATPLWQSKYEATKADLPTQRSEVLSGVLAAVGVRASEEEQVALHKPPTTNGFAYECYLQARAMLRHPDQYPPRDVVQQFERALAADSLFAEAHAALGWARILAREAGDTTEATISDAVARVQRAVELGFRNSETFRVWGAIEQDRKAYDRAVQRYEQAVNIAPSDAEARRRLAVLQSLRGLGEQSVASASRAVLDDPENVDSYLTLGLLQQFTAASGGDTKEEYAIALETLQSGLLRAKDRNVYTARYLADLYWYVQQPEKSLTALSEEVARNRKSPESLYMLARVQQAAGRPKQEWMEVLGRAWTNVQDELKLSPANPERHVWAALVLTRLGRFKDGVAESQQALQLGSANPHVLYGVARMYALQRETKQSLDFLRKAVDRRYDLVAVLDMDFFNLHADPEFLRALTR